MNPHGVRKSNFEHAMAGLEDQTPNAKARMKKHQRPNKTKHIHQMQTQLCNKQFSPWVAIIDKKYQKYVGWKHPNIYIFDKWNCGEAISDKMTGVAQATKGHTLNQWNVRDRCLHFFFECNVVAKCWTTKEGREGFSYPRLATVSKGTLKVQNSRFFFHKNSGFQRRDQNTTVSRALLSHSVRTAS